MSAQIPTANLDGGLNAYDGGAPIGCAVVFIVFGTLFITLRFYSQVMIQRSKLGLEDWIMIPAWILLMGQCADVIISVTQGGVGRHEAWVVKHNPKALKAWAQTLFVTEILYALVICLVKTSITCLYLRIFGIHRWFRISSYVLLATVWMWGAALILTAIFQCSPVAYQWDKTLNGKCIDQLTFYHWVNFPNVVHDVFLLVLPMPLVWKLQVSTKKKLGLTAVFTLGTLGLIASAIRLSEFWKLNAFSDTTWASVRLMGWTLAEPGVIFVCACMPALWPLLSRLFGFDNNSSSRRSGNSGKPTGGRGTYSKARRTPHGAEFIPLKDGERNVLQSGDSMEYPKGITVTRDIMVTRDDHV